MSSYPLTNAQKAAIARFEELSNELLPILVEAAKACHEARVSLPHKNEEGENIVHGSNMRCFRIMESLLQAAFPFWWNLPRDSQDAFNKKHGVKMNMLRFDGKDQK